MLVRVPQHLEVPSRCSSRAGVAAPRSAVLVRVKQHLEVPSPSSIEASQPVPRAAAVAEPDQCIQVPPSSSSSASVRGKCALPVVDQLREHAHHVDGRGEGEQRGRLVVLRVLRAQRRGGGHEPGHALKGEHHKCVRAEEVHATLLLGRARVVAEGLARKPGAREVGIAEELEDGVEQVTAEGADQRWEGRLGACQQPCARTPGALPARARLGHCARV
ncbi:hypothetical protein T492DRAFT_1126167 [Pavlovales sp. CCMP2436]|nr:hypothetical protein T492DRAFT_1126167 [Pavlovales sp. CCMP2436]